jgi:hypothetical protein
MENSNTKIQEYKNLAMQLVKPSQNYLIKYIRTDAERQVVEAASNLKLKNLTRGEAERLIEVVGKWGYYLGLIQKLSADDILLLCKFIKNTFPELTVEELELAINLKMKGLFENATYYGQLTPLYISEVLNSYKIYKEENLKEVFQRRDTQELPESPKLTPEDNYKILVDAILYEWEKYQKNGEVDDLFSIIYSFAIRTGRIDLSTEKSEDAERYATQKLTKDVLNEAETIGDLMKKTLYGDASAARIRYRRNYSVMLLFSKITDIKEFVSGIEVSEA